MFIIVNQIKEQIYDILTKKLKYVVYDNPYTIPVENRTFPYIQLSLSSGRRAMYENAFKYSFRYKIHIFSDYDGEQEILDMEEKIFDAMQDLYENEFITFIRETGFNITDDKSTGTVRKHGILSYSFLIRGGYESVKEDDIYVPLSFNS